MDNGDKEEGLLTLAEDKGLVGDLVCSNEPFFGDTQLELEELEPSVDLDEAVFLFVLSLFPLVDLVVTVSSSSASSSTESKILYVASSSLTGF